MPVACAPGTSRRLAVIAPRSIRVIVPVRKWNAQTARSDAARPPGRGATSKRLVVPFESIRVIRAPSSDAVQTARWVADLSSATAVSSSPIAVAATPTVARETTDPSRTTASVPFEVIGTYVAPACVAGTPAPSPTAVVWSAASSGTGSRTRMRTVTTRLRVLRRPTERTRRTCVPGSSRSEYRFAQRWRTALSNAQRNPVARFALNM